MKKSILVLGLSLVVFTMSAQLVSKRGEPILPQKGDWAIGIEANPFLEYLGNFFGKTTTNNAPTFNFLNNQVIVGKYFVDSMMAYRAGVRIGLNSNTSRMNVDQLPSTAGGTPNPFPTAPLTVENAWKVSETNIGLTAGLEWRKGKTRLQGYYGGEVGIFYSSSKDVFSYGNALNASPVASLVVDVTGADSWGPSASNVTSGPVSDGGTGLARVTERKNGGMFIFGVRGFIGVEYFIAPKISLGGEFGWGLGVGSGGKTTTTYESIGNTGTGGADATGTTTVETPGSSQFILDTDNNNTFIGSSGALRLNFHF
jgi:hypothetical protein